VKIKQKVEIKGKENKNKKGLKKRSWIIEKQTVWK
jgi:hypothetical protein